MAVSKNTLTLFKSLYWILGSLLHLYVCYLLFANSRAIAGILWLILGFIMLYIMYFVFFPMGDPGSQWPPYITACPDYLTKVSAKACMDFVGLNTPHLKKADPANPPAPSDPSYSQYVFDPTGSVTDKAARAQQYGLTWEGIY